ncbi:hypothetical protein SAMN04515667_0586 [Formosa sp. Hel1_31_208]|uniref:hypothetical protein n=1 Tax=Formosa sp. Hel1_31_208 TaxID=1798225 RepID=UPI00087B2ADE|nr:hypothetical protein [Formosa sp. Hel1_31_208]SDR76385.1 hypothetical protein SAMN04515667_0586 [Formosa sp. Hel1_31_208]
MKISKSKLFSLALFTIVLVSCSNAYKFQKSAPFKYTRAYFQNWTAAIKIGSSGVNFHIANLTPNAGVVIDSVYFRKMSGKLISSKGKYVSQLVKRKPISEGHTLTTTGDFPFKIGNRECVVSYTENGETKYFKITDIIENEGVYYEDGPPSKL